MEKIKSFQKNHNTLEPGLYLQEVKHGILIYDLRFVKPNTEFIPIEAIHTIEHLFATWLKTKSLIQGNVISFNPGGCQTMFYLEVLAIYKNGEPLDITDFIRQELLNCIRWCLGQTEVPGATEKECGNYKSHNLEEAKKWLLKYKKIIEG